MEDGGGKVQGGDRGDREVWMDSRPHADVGHRTVVMTGDISLRPSPLRHSMTITYVPWPSTWSFLLRRSAWPQSWAELCLGHAVVITHEFGVRIPINQSTEKPRRNPFCAF